MRNYVIRRLLQLIPVLFGISIAIFAVLRLIPGGFASGMLGIDATPELIAQVNARYGLDQPVITQYLNWIGGVLHGDFGISFRSGAEILPEILTRFQVTAELAILAAIISWCIALPWASWPPSSGIPWPTGWSGWWPCWGYPSPASPCPSWSS